MTRGTRLCISHVVETPDGYMPVPVREGEVLGHPVGEPGYVLVRWTSGSRTGRIELMRVDEAERWVWRGRTDRR